MVRMILLRNKTWTCVSGLARGRSAVCSVSQPPSEQASGSCSDAPRSFAAIRVAHRCCATGRARHAVLQIGTSGTVLDVVKKNVWLHATTNRSLRSRCKWMCDRTAWEDRTDFTQAENLLVSQKSSAPGASQASEVLEDVLLQK